MQRVYREKKTAQAAAHLLQQSNGSLPYISLLKMLYLADRKSLIETGFTITGDQMVSMPYGPVLRTTLGTINMVDQPDNHSVWFDYVSPPQGYDVKLSTANPDSDELSDFEIAEEAASIKMMDDLLKQATSSSTSK